MSSCLVARSFASGVRLASSSAEWPHCPAMVLGVKPPIHRAASSAPCGVRRPDCRRQACHRCIRSAAVSAAFFCGESEGQVRRRGRRRYGESEEFSCSVCSASCACVCFGGSAGLSCPERSRREPCERKTVRSTFRCADSPAACSRFFAERRAWLSRQYASARISRSCARVVSLAMALCGGIPCASKVRSDN